MQWIKKLIKFNTLNTKKNNLEKKIPDASTLIHINQYNTDKQSLQKKIEDVDQKIPDVSGLVTSLHTKIKEMDNRIPDLSCLVKKTDYDAKISEIEGK